MLDVQCSTFISFLIDQTGRFFGQRPRLYETTPKMHDFLMIELAAFQASSWPDTRHLAAIVQFSLVA
jgi:hypothetical protein